MKKELTNRSKVLSIKKSYKDEIKSLSFVRNHFDYRLIENWIESNCEGNYALLEWIRHEKIGWAFCNFALNQIYVNGHKYNEKRISELQYADFLTSLFLLPDKTETIKVYLSYDKEAKKGVWGSATQLGVTDMLELWEKACDVKIQEKEKVEAAAQ